MWKLSQVLALLDREQVDQVVLQEGSVPCTRSGDELKPISRQIVERSDLDQLLNSAGILGRYEKAGPQGVRRVPFTVENRPYQADILTKKNRLQLRVSLGRESEYEPIELELVSQLPPPVPTATGKTETPLVPEPAPPPLSATGPQATVEEKPPVPKPQEVSPPEPQVKLVRDQAAIQALESILSETRRLGASDIHISSGYPPQVRRVGHLVGMGKGLNNEHVSKMLLSLLNASQQSQLDKLGYTDLAIQLPKAGRFRVNISRQRIGLKGCFRLIPAGPIPLAKLGMPKVLEKIMLHHQGLVVVSGPNGAGKTTTMASLVDLFNASRPIHIITVEDPIEILHQPKTAVISQREVGRHTRTFDTALKGALREDPDVIAIGELRDIETVEMALSAAETGHLVIATMNTPSGAVTIDRLIDMFPRGVQSQVRNTLAGTLKMIISQRLVVGKDGARRFAAIELITGNIPLYAMIRDNKLFQLPSLLQQGRAYGMIRIEDSLNNLLQKGVIDIDVARAAANDPQAITDPAKQSPESEAGADPNTRKSTKLGMSFKFKEK